MAERSIKHEYPVARLVISSPFYVGEVDAVVMDTPVANFIVGNHARLNDNENLPVYAKQPDVAVMTRGQAAAEGRPQKPLKVEDSGLLQIGADQLKTLQLEDESLQSCRDAAKDNEIRTSGHYGEVKYIYKKVF